MKLKKRGRPPLPEGERREKSYFVRLRPDEYEQLKGKAAGEGFSVASYIRMMCLGRMK